MSTGGPNPTWRTIREEQTFERCLGHLPVDADQLDELLANLTWRLGRDAEGCSFPIAGHQTRITFTEALRNAPAMRVLFWIEGDVIALAWIDEADDAAPLGFDDFLGDYL